MRETSNTSPKDVEPEIAHVLFTDIVGYSKLPMDEQTHLRAQLKEIVRETNSYRRAQDNQKAIGRPTGDGMALVFFGHPAAPVDCAIQISHTLRSIPPTLKLRMGIHTGPVRRDADINDQLDVAGGGINLAQRVMDIGDAGHILLSKAVAENLWQLGGWDDYLHDLGEVKVKHGARVHIFNLYGEDFGNSNLPERFGAANSQPQTSPSVTFAPNQQSKKAADLTEGKTSADNGPVAPSKSHAAVISSADPDISAQPGGKFSPRLKQVVVLLLFGTMLGLLCAVILASAGWVFSFRETKLLTLKPPVSMVGSGTVYRYLTDLGFFKNLENANKNVSVLEGPTGAGAALAFNNPEPSTVLVMAAERLTPDKLKEYTKRPGDIYEIYLGSDPLEVLFAIGQQRNSHRIEEDNFFMREKQLTKAKLLENWGVEKFDIYVGAEGSGTKNHWESYLFGVDKPKPAWWSKTKVWDIRINRIVNDWQSESRIYLGSTALNKGDSATLDSFKAGEKILIPHAVLPIFDDEGKKVKRGLYLYGWIDTSKSKLHGKGDGDGYNLEPSVVEVLKYVFNSLNGVDREILNEDCLKDQIAFFHLRPKEEEGEGWVTKTDADSIHRPEPCKERIE